MIDFHDMLKDSFKIYLQINQLSGMNVKNPAVNDQPSLSKCFLNVCSFDQIDTLLLNIKLYQTVIFFFFVLNGI